MDGFEWALENLGDYGADFCLKPGIPLVETNGQVCAEPIRHKAGDPRLHGQP